MNYSTRCTITWDLIADGIFYIESKNLELFLYDINTQGDMGVPIFDWPSVKKQFPNWGLLLGNGSSSSLWERFRYTSLFGKASNPSHSHYLSKEDIAIFNSLSTRNFELVLSGIASTKTICIAAGKEHQWLDIHYERIRMALIEAVRRLHVPWISLPESTLTAFSNELSQYRAVFTTNYDLLLYWAKMHGIRDHFPDYFWGKFFDMTDTEIRGHPRTPLHFLHGALHIYVLPSGKTIKRSYSEEHGDLLTQFGTLWPEYPEAVPLIISEGKFEDKRRAILKSEYLKFCYSQFIDFRMPVAIFGHGLGDSDLHLIQAIATWKNRPVAISIHRTSSYIDEFQSRLRNLLPAIDLRFFFSDTHPLGQIPATPLVIEPPKVAYQKAS